MLLIGTTSHFTLRRDAVEKLRAGNPYSSLTCGFDIGLPLFTADYVDYVASREDVEVRMV